MKPLKYLAASLLALSVAGTAQAQTVLHLTGSTAFRTAVHEAITNILQPGYQYGYVGSSFTGASEAIFTGTTYSNAASSSGLSVIIKTSWSGSLAGIETVSQAVASTVSTFLTNTSPQSAGGTSISSGSAQFDPATQPDACMSDGWQSTCQYPSPVLNYQIVGAVTFKFLKNGPNAATNAPGLTNMTPLLAQALWGAGSLPLSSFSGNPADSNTWVFAIGRDPDSGTRKTAFLETGIQTYVNQLTLSTIFQYQPTNAAGAVITGSGSGIGPITGQQPWPMETVDNIPFDIAQAGYSSGGQLAAAMTNTSPYIYVTYLGLSDAKTAESGGAVDLTYNGIPYSDQAVQNGQYSFWTFEQLDYLSTYISANQKAVADELAMQMRTNNAVVSAVGEPLSTMHVTRSQEGGPITQGTPP
jgi:hypothetical protein